MPTFTISPTQINQGTCMISGKDAHHLKNVLRIKPGECIWITDGQGHLFETKVQEIGKIIILEIIEESNTLQKPYPVHLFLSLLKKDAMEMIVQKAVELNIEGIYFVKTERSIRENLTSSHWERMQRIQEAAQKQCGRVYPLEVEKGLTWKQALETHASKGTHFFFQESGRRKTLKEILQLPHLSPPYGLWIGPEGGWEESERKEAHEKGFHPVTLGPLILKAQTASLHAMSSLIALLF